MLLQQENAPFVEVVTPGPDRHSAAHSIHGSRHRHGHTVDDNLAISATNAVAICARNTLDQRHIGRQIPAIFHEVSNPLWRTNQRVIAAFRTTIIDPVEADRRARRTVKDEFRRQPDG